MNNMNNQAEYNGTTRNEWMPGYCISCQAIGVSTDAHGYCGTCAAALDADFARARQARETKEAEQQKAK